LILLKLKTKTSLKKNMIMAMALLPLLASAQSTPFSVTVKLPKLKNDWKAYLIYQQDDKRIVDSVVGKDGVWSFKGAIAEPVKAYLLLDHTGAGPQLNRTADLTGVYLEKGKIEVTGTDNVKQATLTGGAINKEYVLYKAQVLTPTQKVIDSLDAAFLAASAEKKNDAAFREGLMSTANQALEERGKLKVTYIQKHPDSYVSLDALLEVANEDNDDEKAEPLFKALSAKVQATKRAQKLAGMFEAQKAIAIGAMAPEFTQNDVNDKPVKLSDFKGKYVLLDFWASWCGPCRQENPNVVKAYNKYKDKNFTVLGVSLDRPDKKDAWVAAIKKDSLEWTQVSDLQFWENAVAKKYLIRSIPQNFLIDPNGKIISKNLRGEDLDKKLEELFAVKQ